MTKAVAAKTWALPVVGGRRYSAGAPQVGSLVFTGIVDEETDRLDLPIAPINVGAGDFTIEFWIRALNTNTAPSLSTGASYLFPNSNIVMDRDNLSVTRDFGAGLAAGRMVFSVENSNGAYTVVATTDLRDNEWHHVALQRQASDGWMSICIDGSREVQATGPTGDISYQGSLGGHHEFLVFGTEKHGFQEEGGLRGRLSAIHIWDSIRYSGSTYTVPTGPISGALARYLMSEQSGTTVGDSAGSNDGFIAAGGVPAWSSDGPFS